jgi:cystathionine beta-lyase
LTDDKKGEKMKYAFDKMPARIGTNSVKWEYIVQNEMLLPTDQTNPALGDTQLLPMWVADMDFASPQPVIDALKARVEHGLFGYTLAGDDFLEASINWMATRNGWQTEKEWYALTPGIVAATYGAIRAYVKPGEKVLVNRPVYYPFFSAIENSGCEIVSNTLRYENGEYTFDFDDLAEKAADPAVKLAILCSPHNPVGRVWTREELTRYGEICLANDVIVFADEIHSDLIFSGVEFVTFAGISPAFAQHSLTAFSPSKTFNLAGLKTSNIVIPDQTLREKFAESMANVGIYGANVFGVTAGTAAYNHGAEWLSQAMAYIEENDQFMRDYLAKHIPQIKAVPCEGTYLVWLDCEGLGLDAAGLRELFFDKAKVYLDDGDMFGEEGALFQRINLACPRSFLAKALDRIKVALEN